MSAKQAQSPKAAPAGAGRRVRQVLLALVVVLVLLLGVSLGGALAAPGTDSVSARLAEWGRSHGLSSLIDHLERVTYKAPAVGGAPSKGSPLAAKAALRGMSRSLSRIPALASPPLPNEGVWVTMDTVHGRPALQETFLRPDAEHTSYTAGVAWMDPSLLSFALHPGTQEPGGSGWVQPTSIVPSERPDLVAAFNGGFRLDTARGGFFENGRTRGSLRTGAASLVIKSDGSAMVGQWGRDIRPGSTVTAVRQNLDLLVDGGVVQSGLDSNSGGRWGHTLGNKLYVWRSGIGQTAAGALVYVAGNRLSATTLAELLRRAGSVRAMELDINPEWTSFVTYGPEKNLLPDMQRSPRRYDSTSTRDFVTVSRRGP
ncbi:MAG: hypothetical protein JWO12_2855 [Frankiales bacterium]|nr:hypothetical protein [Frankiales bacterium]